MIGFLVEIFLWVLIATIILATLAMVVGALVRVVDGIAGISRRREAKRQGKA